MYFSLPPGIEVVWFASRHRGIIGFEVGLAPRLKYVRIQIGLTHMLNGVVIYYAFL